jgi:hypothetical protein
MVGTASEPPSTVVSPPSAPNLNSLLTGHAGQEGETLLTTKTTMTAMAADTQAEDTVKSPKKKKSKKVKSSKEDKSTKHDRSDSILKQSSFTMTTPNAPPSAKEYRYKHVFYKAGLELRGEDKYGTYVKQIGNLLENIQLVDPMAIMHAVDKTGGTKPLRSETKMSTNMTIFLAYAPVGSNANAFKPKKNSNKKQGCKGKNEPDSIDPSMYPTLVFSSDVDPNIIISQVTHEFSCTGGFYF